MKLRKNSHSFENEACGKFTKFSGLGEIRKILGVKL